MPLQVLIALFLAFGFNASGEPAAAVRTRAEVAITVAEVFGSVLFVGGFAFLMGRLLAWLVARQGRVSPRIRRAYVLSVRLVDVVGLLVYGQIIYDFGWSALIQETLGDVVFLDEALIFLPYPLIQILGWWGLYFGERAIRWAAPKSPARSVWLKARQSFGMILPVAIVYAIGADVVRLRWPESASSPWDKPLTLALMGAFVLSLSPLLVRIAWPTRPLPPGPLRDRLERLSHRVGFRCTDILVWDTNGMVINAGVTGSLPFFRYVLLTDALVDTLAPPEIAAVFGHEIGHIAHRHLVSFGLFILGSLGVYALTDVAISTLLSAVPRPPWLGPDTTASIVIEIGAALLAVGGYFLVVFGTLSRRFERQADVFGCRMVSCGQHDCPPHVDFDDFEHVHDGQSPGPGTPADALCPVGIRIFVNALSNVAYLNGMKPAAWSWRHGSILRRIAFLESLTNRPEAERKFQKGVSRMRKGVALMLALAIVVAVWNGLFH